MASAAINKFRNNLVGGAASSPLPSQVLHFEKKIDEYVNNILISRVDLQEELTSELSSTHSKFLIEVSQLDLLEVSRILRHLKEQIAEKIMYLDQELIKISAPKLAERTGRRSDYGTFDFEEEENPLSKNEQLSNINKAFTTLLKIRDHAERYIDLNRHRIKIENYHIVIDQMLTTHKDLIEATSKQFLARPFYTPSEINLFSRLEGLFKEPNLIEDSFKELDKAYVIFKTTDSKNQLLAIIEKIRIRHNYSRQHIDLVAADSENRADLVTIVGYLEEDTRQMHMKQSAEAIQDESKE